MDNLRFSASIPEVNLINNSSFKPLIFRPSHLPDKLALEELFKNKPFIQKYDSIRSQIIDLIKSQNPSVRFTFEDLEEQFKNFKKTTGDLDDFGVWIYYPWSEKIVHLLDERDFVTLRTNRNKYKITAEEHELLATKKIGVIGLSVGQSVALTLAMERSFGELRIADFDSLELTNLNRIRTGVHNLGLLKTVCVAREIAEIDPYLKVTCFHEGINMENLERFFFENGKLDIVVDECDSIDIKIALRFFARKHGIPVVMDTSDRGMLDIERFDLEPERPIFHGRIKEEDLDITRELSASEKFKLAAEIVGLDTISEQLKISLAEVGKTISTWPQLASAVGLGGGAMADICRKINLKKLIPSGRYYLDIDENLENNKN